MASCRMLSKSADGRGATLSALDRKTREFNVQALMFGQSVAGRLGIFKTTVNEILKREKSAVGRTPLVP